MWLWRCVGQLPDGFEFHPELLDLLLKLQRRFPIALAFGQGFE
ncbi:hypothetical protein [Planctomyces sp. SH-PL14]|nr:hypothetical protein [Planctomyces sp. SH-PL14]